MQTPEYELHDPLHGGAKIALESFGRRAHLSETRRTSENSVTPTLRESLHRAGPEDPGPPAGESYPDGYYVPSVQVSGLRSIDHRNPERGQLDHDDARPPQVGANGVGAQILPR